MEFRKMRRSKQEMPRKECIEVLERNTSGTLAVLGEGGYPYAVPVSYVYDGDAIYFHGSKKGHKIDAIKEYEKASFCVIDNDLIVPEEFTTYFRSVIAFGKIQLLNNEEEAVRTINLLAKKYSPDESEERVQTAIRKEWPATQMIKLSIEHMTGKEAIEFVKARK